jgi:hypothetical protein
MTAVSTNHKKNVKLLHEKYAFRYFKYLCRKNGKRADSFEKLSKVEIQAIQRIKIKSLVLAGLFGTLGVLLLYLPQDALKNSFGSFPMSFPWVGVVEIPALFTFYGLFLAILEVAALVILNLYTVYKIAYICGFPDKKDPFYERHLENLFEVSLDKPETEILELGINPFEGLSKFQIISITILNTAKATLSNFIIKVVLARVLGRFAIREVIDLVGIPVFAFWNAYTTYRIIEETKFRIMGANLIHQFTEKIVDDISHKEDLKDTLYEMMQVIAVVKRNFHHNHHLLFQQLVKDFEIDISQKKPFNKEAFFEKIKALDPEIKQVLQKILIFGIVIDGKLSAREKKVLTDLKEKDIIDVDFQTIRTWEKSFRQGKGLEALFS